MFDRALNICPKDTEEQNQVHSKLLEDFGKMPVLKTASSGPIEPYTHEQYNQVPRRIGTTDFSDSSNLMAQAQIVDLEIPPSFLKPNFDLLRNDSDRRLKSKDVDKADPGSRPIRPNI